MVAMFPSLSPQSYGGGGARRWHHPERNQLLSNSSNSPRCRISQYHTCRHLYTPTIKKYDAEGRVHLCITCETTHSFKVQFASSTPTGAGAATHDRGRSGSSAARRPVDPDNLPHAEANRNPQNDLCLFFAPGEAGRTRPPDRYYTTLKMLW